MRVVLLATLFGLCASAGQAAWTPDLSSWNYYWDFNNGPQGWTVGGNAAAKWVDPAVEPNGPNLPDGAPSGGGAGNFYLPDQGYAELDVTSLNLGSGVGKTGFLIWARVYIPNLRPLTGFNWNYPGNMNHRAGLAVLRIGDNKPMYVGGKIEDGNVRAMDKTWDNTSRYDMKWTMEEVVTPDGLWWDKWIDVVFDYNYTTPGKWNAGAYIPWQSPMGPAGWHTLAENIDCTPVGGTTGFFKLRLGAVNDGTSWTQSQFDDVKLRLVPEPGSLVALGTGLIGLLGVISRRRA